MPIDTCSHHWHYDYPRIACDTGFAFSDHNQKTTIEKYGLGSIDIERIIKECDITLVERFIHIVIEYTIDADEVRVLEPNFVKLFRLAQLSVEYLSYCKKYLDKTTSALKKEFDSLTKEYAETKKANMESETEVRRLRKRVKDLKTTLYYQRKFQTEPDNGNVPLYRCSYCPKVFSTKAYLESHISRRHASLEPLTPMTPGTDDTDTGRVPVHVLYQAENDRLQLEIKELKERLNCNEKSLLKEAAAARPPQCEPPRLSKLLVSDEIRQSIDSLHDKFESLKVFVEGELDLLRSQKNQHDTNDEMFQEAIEKLSQQLDAEPEEKKSREDVPDERQIENLYQRFDMLKLHVEAELKVLHAQTSEHEKYDKLMNAVLAKFESLVLERTNQADLMNSGDFFARAAKQERRNSETQTEPEAVSKTSLPTAKARNVFLSNIIKSNNYDPKAVGSSASLVRMSRDEEQEMTRIVRVESTANSSAEPKEEELSTRTKQGIERLGEQLEQKVTGGIQKLEGQMEYFMTKLKQLESSTSAHTNEKEERNPPKPQETQTSEESESETSDQSQSPRKTEGHERPDRTSNRNTPSLANTVSNKRSDITREVKQLVGCAKGPNNKVDLTRHSEPSDDFVFANTFDAQKELGASPDTLSLMGSMQPSKSLFGSSHHSRLKQDNVVLVKSSNAGGVLKSNSRIVSYQLNRSRIGSGQRSRGTSRGSSGSDRAKHKSQVQQLSSKSKMLFENTGEFKSSDSETEMDVEFDLQAEESPKRGVKSMTNALYSKPEIMKILKQDVADCVSSRLKGIGIDPKWKGIPEATYIQKCDVLKNRARTTAKTIEAYDYILVDLVKTVEATLNDRLEKQKRNPSPQATLEKKDSRLKVILSSVKNKAKSMVRMDRKDLELHKRSLRRSKPPLRTPVRPLPSNATLQVKAVEEVESDISSSPDPLLKPACEPALGGSPSIQVTGVKAIVQVEKEPPEPDCHSETTDSEVAVENVQKSVLRSTQPSAGSLLKKKVLFAVDSAKASPKPSVDKVAEKYMTQRPVGEKRIYSGSSTSIASSVFDGSKVNVNHGVEPAADGDGSGIKTKHRTEEDIDWIIKLP